MRKAVAYIRVSTELQASEGVSLEAQRAKIAAWCLLNDYELSDTFTDEGISGSRMANRPGLLKAIEHACKTSSALVVYSLSRLSRSTKDTLELGEKLEKSGADLVSLSEKIDTTSAAGKMVFRMLAVLAEFERDQISERTKLGLRHKKAKGERVGKVPFGYDLASDGIQLMKNDLEQSIIVAMKDLRHEGATLQSICNDLKELGVLTKSGKSEWTPSTVKHIIETVA
jgi:site-specific DNA recombinase